MVVVVTGAGEPIVVRVLRLSFLVEEMVSEPRRSPMRFDFGKTDLTVELVCGVSSRREEITVEDELVGGR